MMAPLTEQWQGLLGEGEMWWQQPLVTGLPWLLLQSPVGTLVVSCS
jgi:hypothetical protein